MRQLYLAATGMNRGKTTVSLGLLAALIDRELDTGFIKPVGQRYAVVDDVPADEDAILMKSVFGMPDPLTVMSPVHIPRGFTKSYIGGEVPEDLPSRIRDAHAKVSRGRDV
ncbi:MAG: AAA family ATPase, partial [Chloroflexota bacterium]|nr:AAA family ATPase [Chloroflexota bacterium]